MVDRYYRKIENVGNDIENSIQISGILLKLKGYDEKLSHLSKIGNNENNISSNLRKIDTNKDDISSNLGKIDTNKNDIATNYNDISTNKNDIATNSSSISVNKNNIETNTNLINTNKSSYNLNEMYIYDIKSDNQTVNKDNHFHIFEKEIINDFKKDSMLEIILKVLTEISNYVLIGFFQILCNFYDDNNNVFYTISLSTSMGSIDKLSTIKSVFIVPINKDITKIKIDFLLDQMLDKKTEVLNLLLKILIVIKYMLNIIKIINYII